jgi:glycosyltransferase involved in cell wall biosynthesis
VRISLVIPTLNVGEHLKECVGSMKGYDEIIVIADKMDNLAAKINMGMKMSMGDYIVVSNDDVVLREGSLRDLAVSGTVTSPCINGRNYGFSGHIWCIPRKALYATGGMWEGYDGFYFDDDDWLESLKKEGFTSQGVDSVNVGHPPEGGTTLHTLTDHSGRYQRNKQTFFERWGKYS